MARRPPLRSAAEVARLVENDYFGFRDIPVVMYESDEELFGEGREPGESQRDLQKDLLREEEDCRRAEGDGEAGEEDSFSDNQEDEGLPIPCTQHTRDWEPDPVPFSERGDAVFLDADYEDDGPEPRSFGEFANFTHIS